MEGNTYTLLDTEILLNQGIVAKEKTNFETQMILNHKQAIGFIIDNPDLFKNKLTYSTIEEIHNRIAFNLGIASGLRHKVVQITASNYQPLAIPAKIKKNSRPNSRNY